MLYIAEYWDTVYLSWELAYVGSENACKRELALRGYRQTRVRVATESEYVDYYVDVD